MRSHLFLMCLLSGGLLVSCQSGKTGSGAAHGHELADNGGFSDGGFYGDTSSPAPMGYPQDGQSFDTRGGAPFSHRDPVDPVVEPVVAAAAPVRAPSPAPSQTRVVARRPASADPYAVAYDDGASYGGHNGAEQAVVTPYVERKAPAEPAVTASPSKPKTSSSKTASTKATSKKAVVSTPKKKSATVATAGTKAGASKVSGKKTGTTVKAVYKPASKTGTKKKATVIRVHDIKRGDTLSKLATRYGVSVAQLKKRNQLTGDTIVVGKRLTID